MARQPEIQYVRYYTYGSAARQLEPEIVRKNKVGLPQPKVRKDKRTVIHFDPIYLCAMFVAGAMLLTMVLGLVHLGIANAEAAQMESYVDSLYRENDRLTKAYEESYDLEEVKQQALQMGLVPMEQVEHIALQVQLPENEPELTVWEQFAMFWTELFA